MYDYSIQLSCFQFSTVYFFCRRQPDKLGWCGTCIKNAEEGTQGYCRPNEPVSNTEDDLIVRVKKAQVYPQQNSNLLDTLGRYVINLIL